MRIDEHIRCFFLPEMLQQLKEHHVLEHVRMIAGVKSMAVTEHEKRPYEKTEGCDWNSPPIKLAMTCQRHSHADAVRRKGLSYSALLRAAVRYAISPHCARLFPIIYLARITSCCFCHWTLEELFVFGRAMQGRSR